MKRLITTTLAAPLALGITLALSACGNSTATKQASEAIAIAPQLGSGIDTQNMDLSVAPQQDFLTMVEPLNLWIRALP